MCTLPFDTNYIKGCRNNGRTDVECATYDFEEAGF